MEAKADKPKGYEPAYTLQELPPCCRTFATGIICRNSTKHLPARPGIAIAFSRQKAHREPSHDALRRRNPH
jgi:hypothetical protein